MSERTAGQDELVILSRDDKVQDMVSINTDLTRLLKIRTPVIAAPMAGASGGALAAQVTLGGGFGLMQAGYTDEKTFRSELDMARKLLREGQAKATGDVPDSGAYSKKNIENGHDEALAIGVGFLGWKLEESDGKSAALLSIALDARVSAVWFAFGNDLGRWVDLVRRTDAARANTLVDEPVKPHKTLVFVLVNSVQEARIAVEWHVDVLVAQGIEAGGHGNGSAPPILALVPEILQDLTRNSGKTEQPGGKTQLPRPPVVAAGGITTGAHVAALLTLGASGVALGTRFLLTPESLYSLKQKEALLYAHAASTVRTTAFDQVRGTLGWPSGVDGRGLRNQIVKNIESGMALPEARQFYAQAVKEDKPDGTIVWSGTGIGLVNEIKPAAEIVMELHEDAVARLRSTYDLLGKVTNV